MEEFLIFKLLNVKISVKYLVFQCIILISRIYKLAIKSKTYYYITE